jgi:hypothetical protein
MWELLEISIPAVVLLPLFAIGAVLWVCSQQNVRSSDVRRSEFQRLQRLAMEEHERAERELEREYRRHKQGDSEPPHRSRVPRSQGDNIDRLGAVPGNGYGLKEVGPADWQRDPEADARRRKHAGDEERRKQQDLDEELHRRKRAEDDEYQRQQEELADRKRRVNLEDEIQRRQADEQEWRKRRADLEAQARREAEEERRRLASELEQSQTERKQEEALIISPRIAQSLAVSSLCVVCQKPTKVKRRCARCKSMNYCSRECQVQHWTEEHKFECRPHDTIASPRGSIDGDSRNFSELSFRN